MEMFSKVFGNSPKEDESEFYKRHGIERNAYLPELDRLNSIAIELGFYTKDNRDIKDLFASNLGAFNIYYTEKELQKYDMTIYDLYKKRNSNGLRSDEFKKDHSGLHVLFAGCSITFGDAMFLEETWSYKTHQMIERETKTSGYFNIGMNGATVLEVLGQTFKYIVKYGNPDVIFLNLPDLNRERGYESEGHVVNINILPPYMMLSHYCAQNNIKLISFSWDARVNDGAPEQVYEYEDPRLKFDNFYTFDYDERYLHMYNYIKNNQDSPYIEHMLKGLDYVHPGVAEHDFYAHFAFNLYQKAIAQND
jgi:hypothetical protein